MGIKKTTHQFICESQTKHNNKYDYSLVEYKNNKTKVKIICPVHGVFEQTPAAHLRGQGCKKCVSDDQRLSLSDFISKSSNIHNNKYDYSLVNYENWKTKIKIICPIHGEFEQIRNNHLRGDGCPKCAGVHRPTTSQFILDCSNIHNNKYDYSLVEYNTAHSVSQFICPVHGIFEQMNTNHQQGQGCPKCASHISKQETELQEWLSNYIDIITNDRTIINPLELDIVIPSKKIAIEYNGLYWHSEQQGKNSKYHLNKYNLCKEQGYRLISVWENEWVLKKDIIKSIILSAMGIYDIRLGARQCTVKKTSPSISRSFYNENHIQGFNGGCHHGLYYNNELLSLMTIDKSGQLHRFVSKKNYQIYGAFSKLLKSYDMDKIYTFADLRHFTGNVYSMNGFTETHQIPPRYWYFKNNTLDIIHRRRFQRKMIDKNPQFTFDPNLTEYENMLANGYDRIWDCGNIRFDFNNL